MWIGLNYRLTLKSGKLRARPIKIAGIATIEISVVELF